MSDSAFKQSFGEVLRELRRERGLSQEALAKASCCHVNDVSFLERGINSSTLMPVFQLAAALNVSPAEFVARVDDRIRENSQRQ